jgi:hypothetical protein
MRDQRHTSAINYAAILLGLLALGLLLAPIVRKLTDFGAGL